MASSISRCWSRSWRSGLGLNALVAVPGLPRLVVARERRERGVHADGDTRLLHARPERIELRQRDRTRAAQPVGRCRAHEDGPGASLEHPLQLGDRLLEDRQRDHRRAEDPAFVVEGPLVVEPGVDRVDRRVGQVGIVRHGVLDEVGDGREHERAVHTQLVEQFQAGAGLAVRGDAVDRLAAHLAQAQALRVVAGVEGHVRARAGNPIEGRVRDELGQLALHGETGPAAHLDELDVACVALREVVEPGWALVEMVVGVEDGETGIDHQALLSNALP